MHYSRNKKRIIFQDDILCRQYYNDTGEVSHLQVLLPGQLLKVLLQSLHGTAGKHLGISKMMQEIRQKFYFSSIATYVRNWVRDCEICIQDKRINNTRSSPELFPYPTLGCRTGRPYANRLLARITVKWRVWEYHYGNRCIFKIRNCLSSLQPHGSKHSKSYDRHYDKTRLLTYTHYNRQRKRFRLQSRKIRNIGHKLETCHNETCTNHRGPRTGPRHNQDFSENGIRRIQETIAQIFTHCNPELQHDISFQYRLWAKPSVPWQIFTEYPRPETWLTI